MNALMNRDIPPLKFAVQNILPEGLVMIAGRPKAMKSWTMLDLVYCVENGAKFLGQDVEKGNALYLALEDSERRLKDRVLKLGHAFNRIHPTVDVEAPYIGFGLEEDIQKWIDESKSPRLIVIDTLARIKPRVKRSNGTAYDLDNELLRNLQKLAISNGICIAMISHLSKTQTDYSFDRITGSAGLQGMTDAMWLIDRGDTENSKASITGRGRDIMDFSYEVKWNDQTWKYEFVGNKVEIERNENRASILNAMTCLYLQDQEKNRQVKPSQVYKYLDHKAQSKEAKNISRTMLRMCEGGEISTGSKFGNYMLNNLVKDEEVPF
jgi:RecA-family ATPase